MPPAPNRPLHRFAIFTAIATGILIFAGGLVTSTGSGLAVPDWPLSFGQFFPPMVGGVIYEHGHRMVATFVGFLIVVLFVWVLRSENRPAVRWLAAGALGTVVLQGALGGVTVLLKLPAAVSVAHGCLAQAFFCLTIVLAEVTNPRWELERLARTPVGGLALPRLCVSLVAVVFVQLILGATTRHLGAGLAIPDFPLAFGGLVPPAFPVPVLIHFLHRIGALVVSALAVAVFVVVRRRFPGEMALAGLANLLLGLLVTQLALGALTIWTWRAVLPTTAHVTVGAVLLATSVLLAFRASRLLGKAARTVAPSALSELVAV